MIVTFDTKVRVTPLIRDCILTLAAIEEQQATEAACRRIDDAINRGIERAGKP